jgi:hypothetical protein
MLGAWHCCRCFNIPFTKTASCDDNMAFLAQVLRELHRCARAGSSGQQGAMLLCVRLLVRECSNAGCTYSRVPAPHST